MRPLRLFTAVCVCGAIENFDVAANEVPKTKGEEATILAIVKVCKTKSLLLG